MKFSKYISKAVTPVMALFQKQNRLLFKHGYDNLRSFRTEFVEDAGTAHRRGDNTEIKMRLLPPQCAVRQYVLGKLR